MDGLKLMVAAFNKILSAYTTDTTGTADPVDINLQQTAQTSLKRKLADIMNYGDHAYHKDIDDGKYYLRDMVVGVTSATYQDFILDNQYSFSHKGPIVGRFVFNYKIKEFSRADNGRPQLKDVDQFLFSDTGFQGEDRSVNPISQPTTLSGSDIVYSSTNMQTVLDRKVTLHNRKDIKITVKGFKKHTAGDKITFANDKTSGYLIADRVRYDLKNNNTVLQGKGVLD
jgi:hypothetical protein